MSALRLRSLPLIALVGCFSYPMIAGAQDARAPVELPEVVVETAAKPKKKPAKPKKSAQAPSSAQEAAIPAEVPPEAVVSDDRAARQANAVGVGTNVPQSVQIISREEIQSAQAVQTNTASVIAKLVPGYSVSNGTVSSASETFRGRSVQVMLDGVVLNTPLRDVSRVINLIDLNNVERIEVIAGASSLYGSNATGGTINFVTKKATPGKPTVSVNTSITAFTENIGESLQPSTAMSISGVSQSGIDYVLSGSGKFADKTYDGAGRELPSDAMLGQGGGDRYVSFNLLGKLGYNLNRDQRFEISGTWLYFDQDPDYFTLYSDPFARPDFSTPYTGKSVSENSKSFSARFTDEGTALGKLTLVGFYNDIQKRFNFSTFDVNYNSIVYYSGNLGAPTSPFNQTVLDVRRGGVNATIETPLNFLAPGAKLTWGGDAIYDETSQQLTNGQDVFNPLEQTNLAAFAQLQVPLGERLTFRGGVRYERYDLTVNDFVRPSAFAADPTLGAFAVLGDLPVTGGDFIYQDPTFNLGATYKVADKIELFGGFSQGFNLPDVGAFTRRAGANGGAEILAYSCVFGGFPPPPIQFSCPPNGLTYDYSTIAPETQIVDNYELGIRGAGTRWRGSLTGFISTSDQGVNFDPQTNTIAQQKERIYGVEFAGQVDVTSNLTLGTVFTWREGRYDDDGDGKLDSYLPNNRIATPYRGTIYGDYRFYDGWVFHLEGEWWSDRDKIINTDGDRFPIDGAFIVNAALSLPMYDGQLYFGATNLFDADFENPTASSVRNLDVNGAGRTVTVGYRKTF